MMTLRIMTRLEKIDSQYEEIIELKAVNVELLAILTTVINHASEMYPHFESERGQREIAEARKAIERAELRPQSRGNRR